MDGNKEDIPEFKIEFNFREIRPHFRKLKKEISDLTKGESQFQKDLLELIKINSLYSDFTTEFHRQQNKYLNYLNAFQSVLHEFKDSDVYEALPGEISEVGVPIDWKKEYNFVGLDLDFIPGKSKFWKLDWQRTHMMQLMVKKDDAWECTASQYELIDHAKDTLNRSLSNAKPGFKKILCLGVFDGNYLMLLASKFKNFNFTIVEPDINLLGTLLRYVPIASQLPADTRWLNSIDEVEHDDSSLIICPDETGQFMPYLKEMFDTLKSRT